MKSKYLSLYQLTSLVQNESLSEKFVDFLAGFSSAHRYMHYEVLSVFTFLKDSSLSPLGADGFLFGYEIPQLDKEFDLLKITKDTVIDIELKSEKTSDEKRIKQLSQNHHYLKMVRENVRLFSYVSSSHELHELVGEKLVCVDFTILNHLCENPHFEEDLDAIFSPKNILISPLNEPERFLRGDYLLTEHQEEIKRQLLKRMDSKESFFFGITGGPGTGKTLLLYDLALTLAKDHHVIVLHSGYLCEGHRALAKGCKNLEIIEPKRFLYREIKQVDYVLIDEAHRLWYGPMEKIRKWFVKAKTVCIFSYDPKQRLAYTEYNRGTAEAIDKLCGKNQVKLTNKIRTNKELAHFIESLFDLNKKQSFSCENIKLFYEPDKIKAAALAKSLESQGYKYIAITPSIYDHSLDYQEGDLNSHRVIGQEFDKVCMIMDNNFIYKDGKLKSHKHPNPDYISSQLLYQGLTRARIGIALVLTETELLKSILSIFERD